MLKVIMQEATTKQESAFSAWFPDEPLRNYSMEEINRGTWIGQYSASQPTLKKRLSIGERWARIIVILAFACMLALEGWLMWQAWQSF